MPNRPEPVDPECRARQEVEGVAQRAADTVPGAGIEPALPEGKGGLVWPRPFIGCRPVLPTPLLYREFVSDRSFRPIILHGVSALSVHILCTREEPGPRGLGDERSGRRGAENEDDLALDAVVAHELHHRRRRRPPVDGDVSRDGASDLGDPRGQRLGSGGEPDDVLVREEVG